MKAMLNAITDEVTFAQVHLERSAAALGEIVEEYFEDSANNPHTPQGKGGIIGGFNQNRVFAGIARDYVVETQGILNGIAATLQRGTEKGLSGEAQALIGVFTKLGTLDRAKVLVYADSLTSKEGM
ncbi:hypothetical protein FACS18949_04650 [Clostridia bacterium]|nr:hypothetical protein FACS189425_07460 [Clostridia bacterium]GHV32746.1 hypothetical protein FACS18949_04650 [Clostridia bacterium]